MEIIEVADCCYRLNTAGENELINYGSDELTLWQVNHLQESGS
jgi:hypothetical protein